MAGGSKAYTVSLNVIGDTSKGQQAVQDLGGKSEASAGRMGKAFSSVLGTLNSTGVLGPFGEAINKIQEGFSKFGEHGKTVGGAFLAAGATATGVGAMMMGLGSKEQQAQNQLKQAIENAGQSYEDYAGKIEKNIKSNEKFGHSSHDSMEAIRILTQATGDTGKALGDMGVAADLAAAKHISLSDAASLLAKVHGGSAKVLKAFGIDVTKAADNSKQLAAEQKNVEAADLAEAKAKLHLADVHALLQGKAKLTIGEQINLRNAQDALKTSSDKAAEAHKKLADMHHEVTTKAASAEENISKLGRKLDGQAAAAADTFGGKLKALKTEIEDGAAKLGQKYGPAITAAGAGMSVFGGIASGASAVMGKLGPILGMTTAATDAQAAANTAEAPTMWAALGPVVLIIAAIALLAVGIYELVTHWKTVWGAIKDVISGAWDFIKGVFDTVFGFIKRDWQLILGLIMLPFGGAFLLIWHFRDQIMDIIGKIPNMIGNVFKSIVDLITWPFKSSFNLIAQMWNNTVGSLSFKIPSWIPAIGGNSFSMPKLPTLAHGGVALGPTLALIGEAGPEAVVPLGSSAAGAAGFGGDTYVPVTLMVDGRVLAKATARFTRDELIQMRRSNPSGPSL